MDDYYSQLPPEVRIEADAAAEWFVDLVIARAKAEQSPLTKSQIWILKHPFWEFSDDLREEVLVANNRAVELVRKIVIEQVKSGLPTMKIRAGLWVPVELERQYELIFTTQQNWWISSVLQSAFLGNPLNGENKEWTPNNKPPAEKASKAATGNTDTDWSLYTDPKNNSTGIWAFVALGAIGLFALVLVTSAVGSNIAKTNYEASVASPSATPIDTGAPVPGDYYDKGKFAWQWVSSPTCATGTVCSQIRVFSKYDCPYEVWYDWEITSASDKVVATHRDAIPAMTRGQTSVAALAVAKSAYVSGQKFGVKKISCGQTG